MKKCKVFCLFLMILFLCSCSFTKEKEYELNLYFMDTYIYISFFSDNDSQAESIKEDITTIYQEYHKLSNRYEGYDNVTNIYSILHNKDEDKELVLDEKLYELLSYAKGFQETTNNRFNIEIGGIIDVWKEYRELGEGVPNKKELKLADKRKSVILLGNNTIKNNHANIDLGAISKGYTTEKVGEYLEEKGINKYLINAGGNVKVGLPNGKENFSIGIQSPNKDGSLLTIVKGNNISVVTSGGYERNYTYDGKTYSHIIDPDTLYPADYMKSVTVVTKDSALGDVLSTTLFLMSVEDGQAFLKNFDAEAIWVTNKDEVIRSEGFNKYEQE